MLNFFNKLPDVSAYVDSFLSVDPLVIVGVVAGCALGGYLAYSAYSYFTKPSSPKTPPSSPEGQVEGNEGVMETLPEVTDSTNSVAKFLKHGLLEYHSSWRDSIAGIISDKIAILKEFEGGYLCKYILGIANACVEPQPNPDALESINTWAAEMLSVYQSGETDLLVQEVIESILRLMGVL